MSKTNVASLPDEVIDICRIASAACSCALYGTFIDDEMRTISVYIEHLEDRKISLDVCEKVMKHIQLSWPEKQSALLKKYHLEVSSPGINKPLLSLTHFQTHVNQPVSVKYQGNGEKPKTLKGILTAASDQAIDVKTPKSTSSIEMKAIISCHLNNDIKV